MGMAVPSLRIAYVTVPKAACTSMLWGLVGLADDRPGVRQGSSDIPEVTPELTIHDWRTWPESLTTLDRLPDSVLAEGTDAAGMSWLVFSAVREPLARLFSAWQSKILCQEPLYVARYGGQPWFPPPPRSTGEVAEGFAAFVEALGADRSLAVDDWHWISQVRLLAIDRVRYGCIAGIDRAEPGTAHTSGLEIQPLDSLVAQVNAHVHDQGSSAVLDLARRNATLLPLSAETVSAKTAQLVADMYEEDYLALGYEPPSLESAKGLSWEPLLRAVRMLVDRHERIADLARIARERLSKIESLESANYHARQESAALQAQVEHLEDERTRLGERSRSIEDALESLVRDREHLERILHSRTWRWSEPLRRIYARTR